MAAYFRRSCSVIGMPLAPSTGKREALEKRAFVKVNAKRVLGFPNDSCFVLAKQPIPAGI
jgi:hypothetical protein